jgi:hypothetical protein
VHTGFWWAEGSDYFEELGLYLTMYLQDVEWDGTNWTDLALDKDRWCTLVNAVISLQVPKTARMVDGCLGTRLQGYHPVPPRPLRYGPFVHSL